MFKTSRKYGKFTEGELKNYELFIISKKMVHVLNAFYRYQDFDQLNRLLEFENPGRILPKLPPKNPLTKVGLNSIEFLQTR